MPERVRRGTCRMCGEIGFVQDGWLRGLGDPMLRTMCRRCWRQRTRNRQVITPQYAGKLRKRYFAQLEARRQQEAAYQVSGDLQQRVEEAQRRRMRENARLEARRIQELQAERLREQTLRSYTHYTNEPVQWDTAASTTFRVNTAFNSPGWEWRPDPLPAVNEEPTSPPREDDDEVLF